MKKSLIALSLLASLTALAAGPQFSDITKKDVTNITREFGANFAHTVVAAPETTGLWGAEVGVAGGTTNAPDFKKVVDASGGKGSDFKTIYHAGLILRAHIPFELFFEGNFLPTQTISDIKISNSSLGAGWNFGNFFTWPIDLALGVGTSSSQIKFHQDQDTANSTPAANIKLKTDSTIYWVGASKTFIFITPYIKVGASQINGDLKASASIFNVSGKTAQKASTSGGYLAAGANLQLFFLKLGFEATQVQGVRQVTGKFSFDF